MKSIFEGLWQSTEENSGLHKGQCERKKNIVTVDDCIVVQNLRDSFQGYVFLKFCANNNN